jgi:hypothetical protein
MRLINTTTFELQEFVDGEIPPYAILSHTWGDQEVSFQEFKQPHRLTKDKAGYDKIVRCCDIAFTAKYAWAWIDTCCIDKTSSAELSEAINSMFEWYRAASVCFALLQDVDAAGMEPEQLDASLKRSRWFTRGWTVRRSTVSI